MRGAGDRAVPILVALLLTPLLWALFSAHGEVQGLRRQIAKERALLIHDPEMRAAHSAIIRFKVAKQELERRVAILEDLMQQRPASPDYGALWEHLVGASVSGLRVDRVHLSGFTLRLEGGLSPGRDPDGSDLLPSELLAGAVDWTEVTLADGDFRMEGEVMP